MAIIHKKVQNLIKLLSSRIPARTAQKIIKKSGVKTGRSIEDTIIYVDDLSEERAKSALRKLKNHIENLHLFGAKAIRILKIKEDEKLLMKGFFDSLTPDVSLPSVRYYPKPLSEKTLKSEDISTPKFIKKYEAANGSLLVFSCKHRVSYRDVYEGNLETDFGETASKYDKIIAIRDKDIQFFNSIFISSDLDYIELRVDLADILGSTVLREMLDKFESQLDRLYFKTNKKTLPTGKVNFFPMIHEIYNQKHDGYIFDLAFQCPTGANRRENLSNFGKDFDIKDLRQEEYHVAGTNQIGNIFIPYKIGVYWDSENTDEVVIGSPKLTLSGKLIMAKESVNILDYAIISNTIDENDFNYVISAIHEYV